MNRPTALFSVALIVMSAIVLCGCGPDASAVCERCHYTYGYLGTGESYTTSSDCQEIDCTYANCGSCFNRTFNIFSQLTSEDCDECTGNVERTCLVDCTDVIPAGVTICTDDMDCSVGQHCLCVKCDCETTCYCK